jgi:hypothetical protein
MNVTEAKVSENISLDLYPMALQSLKNLDLRENISLQELNKYQMFHRHAQKCLDEVVTFHSCI